VITKTLEGTPRDATHWSTRSMAREVGLTQTAVSRIWRAFGLQPHRQDTFKLSKDPDQDRTRWPHWSTGRRRAQRHSIADTRASAGSSACVPLRPSPWARAAT
jgi:hypothetical protein